MSPLSRKSSGSGLRRRVEIQGFKGLTDADLEALVPWLRFTPLANALLVAVAVLADSAWTLAGGALLMLWGTCTSRHPFDAFYNHVISPLEGTPRLPQCARRRLTYFIATAMMAATAWLLHAGERGWALCTGGLMVAMLCILAFTQICVAAEVAERFSRKPGD